jgi:hypothetical protein
VAAAANCHQKIIFAGEIDRVDDVAYTSAADDERRALIDQAVPD